MFQKNSFIFSSFLDPFILNKNWDNLDCCLDKYNHRRAKLIYQRQFALYHTKTLLKYFRGRFFFLTHVILIFISKDTRVKMIEKEKWHDILNQIAIQKQKTVRKISFLKNNLILYTKWNLKCIFGLFLFKAIRQLMLQKFSGCLIQVCMLNWSPSESKRFWWHKDFIICSRKDWGNFRIIGDWSFDWKTFLQLEIQK